MSEQRRVTHRTPWKRARIAVAAIAACTQLSCETMEKVLPYVIVAGGAIASVVAFNYLSDCGNEWAVCELDPVTNQYVHDVGYTEQVLLMIGTLTTVGGAAADYWADHREKERELARLQEVEQKVEYDYSQLAAAGAQQPQNAWGQVPGAAPPPPGRWGAAYPAGWQPYGAPPPQGYAPPPQGYPPQGQGYPPQQGYAPPPQGYPPQGQGYPPQQGHAPPPQGYPPQGQGYPPQQGHAPPPQGYPPQGQGYPPQQGYAPPPQGYPPQGQGYPPQGQGYPPQQGDPSMGYAQGSPWGTRGLVAPRGVETPLAIDTAILKRGAGTIAPVADNDILFDGVGESLRDEFRVLFRTNQDAHVYVIGVDAVGRVQPLFPAHYPDESNPVLAGESVMLPSADAWYGLDEFAGLQHVFFYVSAGPDEKLEQQMALFASKPAPAPTGTNGEIRYVSTPTLIHGSRLQPRGILVPSEGEPVRVPEAEALPIPTVRVAAGIAGDPLVATRVFQHQ